MNKTKKIILMILIILLISLLIIFGIYIFLIQHNRKTINSEEYTYIEIENKSGQIDLIKNYSNYYSVLNAISNYYIYIVEQNIDAIYALLDEEYITLNDITKENILEKINYIEIEDSYYEIKEAYKQENEKISVYYVDGYLKNGLFSEEKTETFFKIYVDEYNSSYSVYYISNTDYNNLIKNGENLDKKEILLNEYNKYNNVIVNDETIVTKIFYDYKSKINNDLETAYSLLNPEYIEKRFNTYEKFEKYVENSNIKNAILNKFNKEINEDINRYICIDKENNYYIFEETAAMQYTVILDTYTIDLPEFIQKYDAGNDEIKIGLNISKVIEAINNKDYEYIYNKLNETFRNNNFNNISVLEEFIKNNFYNISEIKDFSYNQEGNVYICTINLKNKENESDNSKNVTILMRLLEDRNFEISFSL